MDVTTIASQQNAASTSAFSSLTKNIDTFLTLLTTQLRNQDPLEPLDTEKFTEQLVQFASVEQSIKTNSHLEALIALQAASDRDSALGFVGRTVTVASDRAALANGSAEWSYALPNGAATATLSIVDEAGRIVSQRVGLAVAGTHAVVWDGLKDDGTAAPDGLYKLVVDAKAADGGVVNASVETNVRVNAAVFGSAGSSLETPIGLIAIDAVRRVAAANS